MRRDDGRISTHGKRRGNIVDEFDEVDGAFWETRPVRKRDAVTAGLDYWIDERDLERERKSRLGALRSRKKLTEGQFSKEKLRDEVVAPYKQNWIGMFSVMMAVLSMIVTKFPEVIQIPIITIPDI